jgi:hypothetical protein
MQINAFRKDPSISLCHTDFDRLAGRKITRSVYAHRRPEHLAQGDAFISLLRQWTPITATCVYPRKVLADFLRSEFNRSDWPFGDYNRALFASTCGTVHYLPVSTATWRKIPASAGNSGLKNKVRMSVAGMECKELFLNRYPNLSQNITKKVLSEGYERLLKDATIVGDRGLFDFSRNQLTALEGGHSHLRYLAHALIIESGLPKFFGAIYEVYDRLQARRLRRQ